MDHLNDRMLVLMLAFMAYGFTVALCFHPVKFHFINKRKNWFDARGYCEQHYDGLATVTSVEENNRLDVSTGGGWIGLSDRPYAWQSKMVGAHNSWRWSATGSFNIGGFHKFQSKKPDNYGSKEHCVFIRNGQWDAVSCDTKLYFVCFTGPKGPGAKQYTYVPTRMTWAEAKAHCRLNYTDLAMVLEEAENTAVASLNLSSGQRVWIGLYRVPWTWTGHGAPSFTNWAPAQPDNANYVQHCVKIHANRFWSDHNCAMTQPFYCLEVLEIKEAHTKLALQSSANLTDPDIYHQINQQLRVKLQSLGITDVNLVWKTLTKMSTVEKHVTSCSQPVHYFN